MISIAHKINLFRARRCLRFRRIARRHCLGIRRVMTSSRDLGRKTMASSRDLLHKCRKTMRCDKERTQLQPTKKEHVVEPYSVSAEHLQAKVAELLGRSSKMLGRKRAALFSSTVRSLLALLMTLEGGACLICAPSKSYDYLEQIGMDTAVVDSCESFREGYMTRELRNLHIDRRKHQKAMQAFARHASTDRWHEGHDAAHLPKDGCMCYGASGFCRLAAARLLGLPATDSEWEGVGMRHTTALQLCWALMGHLAVVAVRSDSGSVHVLIPGKEAVEVLMVER